MEKKLVNENILEINNDALEEAMEALTAEKTKENMARMMNLMRDVRLLVPAEFPKNMDKEVVAKLARGEALSKKESPRMHPVIVQNGKGERFAPAFTSRKHLSADDNYQAILNVKLDEVMRIASDEDLKLDGILLNPGTSKMILHPQFIEAMKKLKDAPAQNREVKMTKEQFEAFARKNAEWGLLPKAVYSEKAAFMKKLDEQREAYIFSFYRQPFGDKLPCPYAEKDFDVMILNINEETCVASVDLPENGAVVQSALALYIIWNPKNDKMHYYLIEKGASKEENVLCCITADGGHQELMSAPASGNELVTILELLRESD